MLIRNAGEHWKQVQKNVSPQGGASPGILTVTPKGHCPESPAGSRWAPAGDACHVSFRSEATGTVLCSEGGSRGRCAGLQAPRMCVRECLHPESTAPASWGAEASPGWKCRWPCGSECVLWGLVVPSGALLCSDDSTMDAEATACTDSPTSSHSGIHSNSQTNPCLQRFPSFLSSWCPYYLHTFRSQCPGPKYPTIPLLMWLDPNNWSMLEKTVHQSWKKYYSIFLGGPPRNWTQALGSDSTKFQPVDHQGIPWLYFETVSTSGICTAAGRGPASQTLASRGALPSSFPASHCLSHPLETLLCKRRDNFERHVLQAHIEIVSYLKLVVPAVSKKCQVSIHSPRKLKQFHGTLVNALRPLVAGGGTAKG